MCAAGPRPEAVSGRGAAVGRRFTTSGRCSVGKRQGLHSETLQHKVKWKHMLEKLWLIMAEVKQK